MYTDFHPRFPAQRSLGESLLTCVPPFFCRGVRRGRPWECLRRGFRGSTFLSSSLRTCAQSCPTLRPMDCSHQAPLSMRFTRQEHWSGLPCPSLGGASWHRDQTRISALAGRFFTTEPPGTLQWFLSLKILSTSKKLSYPLWPGVLEFHQPFTPKHE